MGRDLGEPTGRPGTTGGEAIRPRKAAEGTATPCGCSSQFAFMRCKNVVVEGITLHPNKGMGGDVERILACLGACSVPDRN